jgi:hypothetical protein
MKEHDMKTRFFHIASVTVVCLASLAANAPADVIAKFADPLPSGGGDWMFMYKQGTHGFYGGWAGPPSITLETPLGSFAECTMHCWPMYVYPTGVVAGGNITFYLPGQVEILRLEFTNGFVDYNGLRCGPQTGGTVQFFYSPGGVQLPPGLSEPLQGTWIDFEFHNLVQGPFGPQWTASFTCGADGRVGDLNCDGAVNVFDIDPFVAALTDPTAYAGAYPFCDLQNADINGDGAVNAFDIDPFVQLLTGG